MVDRADAAADVVVAHEGEIVQPIGADAPEIWYTINGPSDACIAISSFSSFCLLVSNFRFAAPNPRPANHFQIRLNFFLTRTVLLW